MEFSAPSCVCTSSSVGAFTLYTAVISNRASNGSPAQVIVLPSLNKNSRLTGPNEKE
ncbi:hypothetical protein D3C87_1322770 [compost metagenome]